MKNKNISKFIEAKNDFEIALKQFQINQEENLKNIAETYAELGEIEYYLDKYNESEKAYDASLKAYKKLSDKLGEARILKGKANLERVKKNYTISQKYFEDALRFIKAITMI